MYGWKSWECWKGRGGKAGEGQLEKHVAPSTPTRLPTLALLFPTRAWVVTDSLLPILSAADSPFIRRMVAAVVVSQSLASSVLVVSSEVAQ